jgi:hypothetical protein
LEQRTLSDLPSPTDNNHRKGLSQLIKLVCQYSSNVHGAILVMASLKVKYFIASKIELMAGNQDARPLQNAYIVILNLLLSTGCNFCAFASCVRK